MQVEPKKLFQPLTLYCRSNCFNHRVVYFSAGKIKVFSKLISNFLISSLIFRFNLISSLKVISSTCSSVRQLVSIFSRRELEKVDFLPFDCLDGVFFSQKFLKSFIISTKNVLQFGNLRYSCTEPVENILLIKTKENK